MEAVRAAEQKINKTKSLHGGRLSFKAASNGRKELASLSKAVANAKGNLDSLIKQTYGIDQYQLETIETAGKANHWPSAPESSP